MQTQDSEDDFVVVTIPPRSLIYHSLNLFNLSAIFSARLFCRLTSFSHVSKCLFSLTPYRNHLLGCATYLLPKKSQFSREIFPEDFRQSKVFLYESIEEEYI